MGTAAIVRMLGQEAVSAFYAREASVAAAGTANRAGGGSPTFAAPVKRLLITHASEAVYVARTETDVGTPANGDASGRVYIPANTSGLVLPWDGTDVWLLNAAAGETPDVWLVGLA